MYNNTTYVHIATEKLAVGSSLPGYCPSDAGGKTASQSIPVPNMYGGSFQTTSLKSTVGSGIYGAVSARTIGTYTCSPPVIFGGTAKENL
jgi:hypothetical protein